MYSKVNSSINNLIKYFSRTYIKSKENFNCAFNGHNYKEVLNNMLVVGISAFCSGDEILRPWYFLSCNSHAVTVNSERHIVGLWTQNVNRNVNDFSLDLKYCYRFYSTSAWAWASNKTCRILTLVNENVFMENPYFYNVSLGIMYDRLDDNFTPPPTTQFPIRRTWTSTKFPTLYRAQEQNLVFDTLESYSRQSVLLPSCLLLQHKSR